MVISFNCYHIVVTREKILLNMFEKFKDDKMNSQNQKKLEKELEIDLRSEFYEDGVLKVEADEEECEFSVRYYPKSGYVIVDGHFITKDGKAGASIAVARFNVYQFTNGDKDLYEGGEKIRTKMVACRLSSKMV